MLELKHLKALQALYQYGTFSQAASELCVTTSALSHQIAALEGWLDVELISRKTRPFQFTKQGLLLLDLANQVLPMVDQTLIRMQDKKQKIKHKLFVASECHCCFDWLIHVMNAYHDSFPETDLDFITAFEKYPHELLLDEAFDVLITSDRQKSEGVEYLKLFDYESRLVVAPDHPLAYETDITPEMLAKETLLCHPVELNRLDIYNHWFEPAGIIPKNVRKTQQTAMLIQLVSTKRGYAALPDWVVYEYEQQGLVKTLRMPGIDGANGLLCTLYAAYNKDHAGKTYFTEFLNQMRKYAKERDLFYLS